MNLTETLIALSVGSLTIFAATSLSLNVINQNKATANALGGIALSDRFEKLMSSSQLNTLKKSILLNESKLDLQGNALLTYCLKGYPTSPTNFDKSLCADGQNCCPAGTQENAQNFLIADISDPDPNSIFSGTQALSCNDSGAYCQSPDGFKQVKSQEYLTHYTANGAKCKQPSSDCSLKISSSFWSECPNAQKSCVKPQRLFIKLLIQNLNTQKQSVKTWEVLPSLIQSGDL